MKVGFTHVIGDPGAALPFARGGGAGIDDAGEFAVEADFVMLARQGFAQRA